MVPLIFGVKFLPGKDQIGGGGCGFLFDNFLH